MKVKRTLPKKLVSAGPKNCSALLISDSNAKAESDVKFIPVKDVYADVYI